MLDLLLLTKGGELMPVDSFMDLVRRMRAAQKAYFADRSPGNLAEARILEREVDRLIERETGPRAEPMLWDRVEGNR